MQQTVKPEHFKTTWYKQTGNLFAADIIGMGAEGVFITNIGKFDEAFPAVSNAIVQALSVPVYYFQRPLEAALSYTKNFESRDYYDKRLQKPEKERVEILAKAAYHYGMAWIVGWGTMLGSEHYVLSKLNHAPPIKMSYFAADAAIHVGLVTVMALPFMENATQKLKDSVKCMSKTFNLDETQSEDLARVSTFSFIPNFTTLAIVSGMMRRDLKLQSLQKSLNTAATSLQIHP